MIKKTFILLGIVIIAFNTQKVFAQADINMSTHWYNRGNYNPASIARPDYMYVFANARTQWVGVAGAPKVLNVEVSDYYNPLRSAFGLSFVSDKIGVTSFVNPMLTYAYQLSNDDKWSLSMGLSAGVFLRSTDISLLNPYTPGDQYIYNVPENTIKPDANLGIEFQNSFLILGASSTHLFALGNSDSLFYNSNHIFGYAIYKNTSNELIHFNIGTQIVYRNNLIVLEGNANVKFRYSNGTRNVRDVFDIGLSYRTSKIAVLALGFYITEDLRLGYAYDKNFVPGYSERDTHEIMFEYRIPLESATPCYSCRKQTWYR